MLLVFAAYLFSRQPTAKLFKRHDVTVRYKIQMTLGEVFLESLSTGVITESEISWVASQQYRFSRAEEATALKLGRMLDAGSINLGCRRLN